MPRFVPPKPTLRPSRRKSDPPDVYEIVPGNGWRDLASLINVVTYERIGKLQHADDCLRLYCFYARLVQLRGRTTVRATVTFCRKGLRWAAYRVHRARRELAEAGLIEDVVVRTADGAKVERWLIKIHYVASAIPTPSNLLALGNSGGRSIGELEVGKKRRRLAEKQRDEKVRTFLEVFPSGSSHLEDPAFLRAWEAYAAHRSKDGPGRWHEGAVNRLLVEAGKDRAKPLLEYSPPMAAEMLWTSVGNGWIGVFDRTSGKVKTLPPDDHPEITGTFRPGCLKGTELDLRLLAMAVASFHALPLSSDPKWYAKWSRGAVGTPEKLAALYWRWLDEQVWMDRPFRPKALMPGGQVWRRFVENLDERFHGLELTEFLDKEG